MEQLALACPSENELVAWVSAALPPERVLVLDQHLDTCGSCRALLAAAATTTPPIEPPARRVATFGSGEMIAGRYVIRRWLGSGGMGEVYEAEDTWLDGPVALKTIAPTIADDPAALARLKAEVRLARRVTHENVCRVYDLGFHAKGRERVALLSMELLRGITLRQQLKTHGALSTERALPIVKQIVLALANAHQAGVVHRDLKTDNVMLVARASESQRHAVVMDFGLARSALASEQEPLTRNSHRVLGTLDYMSPEQVQGHPATPASDVFSLGIVLYEMLTGELPFAGDSPLARALVRVTATAPRLADKLPRIGSNWDRCVARCLALEPSDRFADIRQVIDCLDTQDARRPPRSTVATSPALSQGLRLLGAALLGAATLYLLDRASSPGSEPLGSPIARLATALPQWDSSLRPVVSPAATPSMATTASATTIIPAPRLARPLPKPVSQPSTLRAVAETQPARPSPAAEKPTRDYAMLIDPQNPYQPPASK
jgi:serine/threonine protein kinase